MTSATNAGTSASTEAHASAASGPDPTVDTRERLVRAAIEVFLEKGYGATRVQDIARRAGFTSGALYVHFPSRTALLGEAIIREGDAILTSMVATLQQTDRDDGRIVAVLAEFSSGEPSDLDRLLLEALALATRDPEARAALAGPLQAFVDEVRSLVAEAQRRGSIDPTLSLDGVAYVLVSWVFGTVMTNALRLVEVDPAEISAINDRLIHGLHAAR